MSKERATGNEEATSTTEETKIQLEPRIDFIINYRKEKQALSICIYLRYLFRTDILIWNPVHPSLIRESLRFGWIGFQRRIPVRNR